MSSFIVSSSNNNMPVRCVILQSGEIVFTTQKLQVGKYGGNVMHIENSGSLGTTDQATKLRWMFS